MPDQATFLAGVRAALKRSPGQAVAPLPRIDEPIVRLVHTEIGLAELFAASAKTAKIDARLVQVDELAEQLIATLREKRVRTIGVPGDGLIPKLGLDAALRASGFTVTRWPELSRDALYSLDVGLTDAWAGVAETGSIVVRSSPQHGRSLSLVPPIHVAIIEPKVLVPDLLDLTRKLAKLPDNPGTVLITGPSKTADIEMNLVTGVHGPGEVIAFVLH